MAGGDQIMCVAPLQTELEFWRAIENGAGRSLDFVCEIQR